MSRDTREMDFAHHRQLFLTEQGYSYEILDESDLAAAEIETQSVPQAALPLNGIGQEQSVQASGSCGDSVPRENGSFS